MKSTCFAPTLTHTFFVSGFQPRVFSVQAQMASFSGGIPVTAVYFEEPASMAFFAASSTACGRLEVGLAGSEREHVDAARLELHRARVHRKRDARRDGAQP